MARDEDIHLGTLAPMVGLSAGDEPDYLDYDIKGRGFFEKMFWHCGASYLLGMGAGGVYGASVGLRQAPSPLMRVRVNAVMNGCSKFGSRAGNAFGVLALYYTGFEWLADQAELDRLSGGYDFVNPVVAGAATGALYNVTGQWPPSTPPPLARAPKCVRVTRSSRAQRSGSPPDGARERFGRRVHRAELLGSALCRLPVRPSAMRGTRQPGAFVGPTRDRGSRCFLAKQARAFCAVGRARRMGKSGECKGR